MATDVLGILESSQPELAAVLKRFKSPFYKTEQFLKDYRTVFDGITEISLDELNALTVSLEQCFMLRYFVLAYHQRAHVFAIEMDMLLSEMRKQFHPSYLPVASAMIASAAAHFKDKKRAKGDDVEEMLSAFAPQLRSNIQKCNINFIDPVNIFDSLEPVDRNELFGYTCMQLTMLKAAVLSQSALTRSNGGFAQKVRSAFTAVYTVVKNIFCKVRSIFRSPIQETTDPQTPLQAEAKPIIRRSGYIRRGGVFVPQQTKKSVAEDKAPSIECRSALAFESVVTTSNPLTTNNDYLSTAIAR